MFIKDGKRWNPPHSKGTTEIDGVHYPNTVWKDVAFRAEHGVREIPDPRLPAGVSHETHYIHELDHAPWLVIQPKPTEVVDAAHNNRVKQQMSAEETNTSILRFVREFMLATCESHADKEKIDVNTIPGYTVMKELDTRITDLRKTLK